MTPLRLGVALGTSFTDSAWWPEGGHAIVSLTSQPAGSRFGMRVEAIFDGDEGGFRSIVDGARHTIRDATIALTINTTYRLTGQRTGLYAIAGVGIYRRWTEVDRFGSGEEVSHTSASVLGANAGLGFAFKAFGRELFVESRLHSGAFRDRIPLSLGIRF